jgi:hypothetical protein
VCCGRRGAGAEGRGQGFRGGPVCALLAAAGWPGARSGLAGLWGRCRWCKLAPRVQRCGAWAATSPAQVRWSWRGWGLAAQRAAGLAPGSHEGGGGVPGWDQSSVIGLQQPPVFVHRIQQRTNERGCEREWFLGGCTQCDLFGTIPPCGWAVETRGWASVTAGWVGRVNATPAISVAAAIVQPRVRSGLACGLPLKGDLPQARRAEPASDKASETGAENSTDSWPHTTRSSEPARCAPASGTCPSVDPGLQRV